MEKELEKQIDTLIREYGIWKRKLQKDTTKKDEANILKVVIQDLKKLKIMNKRG